MIAVTSGGVPYANPYRHHHCNQAIAAIFLDEAFGDFNEKTYLDIATAEEVISARSPGEISRRDLPAVHLGRISRAYLQMFDWMGGPFLDGLYPAELYNGQEMPEDLQAQQQHTHQNNKRTPVAEAG